MEDNTVIKPNGESTQMGRGMLSKLSNPDLCVELTLHTDLDLTDSDSEFQTEEFFFYNFFYCVSLRCFFNHSVFTFANFWLSSRITFVLQLMSF